MLHANDIPQIIQWYEGMLLAPQHFQELSWRHEALLAYHAKTIAPFHWGVRQMEIDTALLVSGTLRVLSLEAIMPDGLVVSHGHEGTNALEADLTALADAMRQSALTVHVAVPTKKPGEVSAEGDLARYASIDGTPVLDDNIGTGELDIPHLRPRLRLLVTEKSPPKYVSFPLARVHYRHEAFALTDFVAPTLSIPMTSPIGEMCSAIVKRLREKALFLSEQVRAPSVAMGAPLMLETKTLIQSLVAALPYFEAVLGTGVAHPYTLYLALCSLVGHVAAVGASLLPPSLQAYNHNDLRTTFEQARAFIFRTLDEGIPETYTGIPFHFDEGVFSLTFDAMWMNRGLILGVRGRSGMSDQHTADWLELCLIGSQSIMPSLQERRILGAPRLRIDGDAEIIPVRGVVLFGLQTDPESIVPNEALQVFNTEDPTGASRPAEIILYVKNTPT
jgi:type VI secretion system protein ImpJ